VSKALRIVLISQKKIFDAGLISMMHIFQAYSTQCKRKASFSTTDGWNQPTLLSTSNKQLNVLIIMLTKRDWLTGESAVAL